MRIENEGHLCIFEETTDLFILNSLRNIKNKYLYETSTANFLNSFAEGAVTFFRCDTFNVNTICYAVATDFPCYGCHLASFNICKSKYDQLNSFCRKLASYEAY